MAVTWHLGTTMVDRDAFTIYPELRDALVAYRLTAAQDGAGGVRPELRGERPQAYQPVASRGAAGVSAAAT